MLRRLGIYPEPDDYGAAWADFHAAAQALCAQIFDANTKLYAAEGLFTTAVTKNAVYNWNRNASDLQAQWGVKEQELLDYAQKGVLTEAGWNARNADIMKDPTAPGAVGIVAAGGPFAYVDPVASWISDCRDAMHAAGDLLAELKSENLTNTLADIGDAACDAVELCWGKVKDAVNALLHAGEGAAKDAAWTIAEIVLAVGGAAALVFFLLRKSGVKANLGPVSLGRLARRSR